MSDLTYLELFAGVGGMSLGFDRAGFRCVGHCEIEGFPRRVLKHRWPDVPLFGDVRELRGDQVETPTIVTFGAPCQDLSIAGKRAGLDGDRSSLFHEGIRLWNETSAPYALYENVLGAFSSNRGEDFAAILSAFVGAAVAVPRDGWPKSGVVAGRTGVAAWRVLDAQFFGVPQRRRRVFVLGARTGALDPAEILAVADRVSWHPPQSREAREGIAADAGTGVESGSLTPWDAQSKRVYPSDGVFPSLAAAEQSGQQQPSVLAINISNGEPRLQEVAATLQSRERDGISPTLRSMNNADSNIAGGGHIGVVAFHATQTPVSEREAPRLGALAQIAVVAFKAGQSEKAGATFVTHELAPTLQGQGNGSTQVPAVYDARGNGDAKVVSTLAGDHSNRVTDYTPIVFGKLQYGRYEDSPNVASTLGARDHAAQHTDIVVAPSIAQGAHSYNGQDGPQIAAASIAAAGHGRPRRLTPLECERLMGWPDRWTDVPDERSKPASDSARYKACGNGVATPVAHWIAQRLRGAIDAELCGRAT